MTNLQIILTDQIKQGDEFEIIKNNFKREKPQIDYWKYVDFILDGYNFHKKQRGMPKFEAKFYALYNSTINALKKT